MSDFIFANPINVPSVDPDQKYMDQFKLSKDEVSRIELIGNTLASDFCSTNSVVITETEDNLWSVHVVPSMYVVADSLHNVIKQYIDGGATINPDRCLVKFLLAKKEYAQCLVQWLQDYNVTISEFSYPIDNFIINTGEVTDA